MPQTAQEKAVFDIKNWGRVAANVNPKLFEVFSTSMVLNSTRNMLVHPSKIPDMQAALLVASMTATTILPTAATKIMAGGR